MNVFCHPAVLRSAAVARLVGVEPGARPHFGLRAHVPLLGGRLDSTEVDMRIGNVLVEAKLTESDFQRAEKAKVLRYRDLLAVFDEGDLPQSEHHYHSYQLIRNVLAAMIGKRRSVYCWTPGASI